MPITKHGNKSVSFFFRLQMKKKGKKNSRSFRSYVEFMAGYAGVMIGAT